jgi:magnesium transporter
MILADHTPEESVEGPMSQAPSPGESPHHHEIETAGRLAVRSFPSAINTEPVRQVLQRLAGSAPACADLLLVVDREGRYRGAVELVRLLHAPADGPVSDLVRADWPHVAPDVDQEHAVMVAAEAQVAALPVVAPGGQPVGIIPPVALLEVLAHEHREDMHRLVGILKERAGSRHALEDPPVRRAARRLPWLLIGLAMSAAATAVMARYEAALQANVTIAFFIPALVYLTDAIGTQTEAIAIRGLSVLRKPLPRILLLEFLTGGMIGLALAAVALAGVWLAFDSAMLALGVAVSLLLAGTLASSIGLILPWALSHLRIDPAFGTGPVATITQDVLTIMIYFAVVTALLGGVT